METGGGEGFDAAVRQALLDGLRDQASVAERLRVSPATLRRRLADRGVGFRILLHTVQNEAARRMIADGAAVGVAAETLGFSDVRSFTRAFKAWNGMTPSTWRSRTAGVSAPSRFPGA